MSKPGIGFDIRARNLDEILKNLESMPEEIKKSIIAHHHWAAPILHREVVRLASGKIIKRRTGRYVRSVRHFFDDERLRAGVGTKLKYALQREFGGTIRPVKSKAGIAVPLAGAKTKAGASKKPRDYPNTFFVRRRDGTLFLFGKRTPKATRIIPLFVFKSSVDQEPGLIFQTAFERKEKQIRDKGVKRIARGFQRTLEDASK